MINIKLPENVSYFQVAAIAVDPESLDTVVDLVDPQNPKQVLAMQFSKVASLQIRKAYDDDEGCYMIGKVDLWRLSLCDVMSDSSLQQLFSRDVPDDIFRLRLEGDICIEIIAAEYTSAGFS